MQETWEQDRVVVLERLALLERENRAWRAETDRLMREVAELRAAGLTSERGGPSHALAPAGYAHRVSRRGVLRLGAAAAAGAGAVTAAGLLEASPALAGSDGDLTLGLASNSAGAPTGLAV